MTTSEPFPSANRREVRADSPTGSGGPAPSIEEVRRSIERLSSPSAPPDGSTTRPPEPPEGRPPTPTPAPPAAGPPPPVRPPIDPRIRRRRIDVRRDEGRRRLRILVGCLAIVGSVAAAAGAGRSPLFDVDYADVRGTDRTPRAEVVRAAGLVSHPAMLDVDTGAVAHRVEALPWVLDATARREWPGTVRIDVTERRPAAVLPAAAGTWAVADRTGRILQIGPEKPAGLPVIGNIPPPERAGASVPAAATASLRVAAALPALVRDRVSDVATLATGEVELQLTPPGGVVRLGQPVDLATKLRVLTTVLARADLARVSVVDVRVPKAPALTRR